jgi:hypothetical protein
MRLLYGLFLVLPGCATHDVRCDGRLQPVNLPATRAGAASESAAAPTRVSAAAAPTRVIPAAGPITDPITDDRMPARSEP